MKQAENKEVDDNKNNKNHVALDSRSSLDKNNLLSSNTLQNLINQLWNPRFLGSIHLKKEATPNIASVDNLLGGELDLKITKSLKNAILNPVTKTLIILALIFNIIWYLLIYLF